MSYGLKSAPNFGLLMRSVCFDPITMLAVGGTIAGAGISAAGSISSGNAAKAAGDLSATATLNSSALTAQGQEEQGVFTQEADEYEAQQLDQNASTTRAEGQRQSFDIAQQTRLALSTLQANAGGSGLSPTGSTPLSVAGAIGARGSYLALSNMANAENTARGDEDAATAARISGAAAKYGGDLASEGTIYAGQMTAKGAVLSGDAAQTAGELGAAGTLASGVGGAAGTYAKLTFPTVKAG